MIKYEFLIFLGLGLALAIAELISVRRAIRRAKEAEGGAPSGHGRLAGRGRGDDDDRQDDGGGQGKRGQTDR